MNKIKRYLSALLILILCLQGMFFGNSIKAQAASCSLSISVSSSNIQKGDTVTVTVSINCSDAIGAYTYYLSYNSSVMEYISGSGSGGGGTVSYAGYGDGSSKSASASFTFKAIAAGSSSFSTSGADFYTWDEETCSVSHASASVSVLAGSSGGTTGGSSEGSSGGSSEGSSGGSSGGSSENTTEATEATTEELSDNYYLSTLEITPGTLSPAFSKEQYSYTTTVPGETEMLVINAIPEDSNAMVSIEGNEGLKPGTVNTITITVTAETGDQIVYTLDVTCEEIVDTRVFTTIDGVEYYFAQDYSKINIPEGFGESTGIYNGSEIIVYTSPNKLINCVYLVGENNKGNWYIYYEEMGTFTPFIQATASYNCYIILTPEEISEIPAGYIAFTYNLNGNEITAYHVNEDDEIILIYAMNTDTSTGWYYYDTVEKTFLRCVNPPMEETEEIATAGDAFSIEAFFNDHKMETIIAAAILLGILLIVIIILTCLLAHTKRKYAAQPGDSDIQLLDDPYAEDPEQTEIAEQAATEAQTDSEMAEPNEELQAGNEGSEQTVEPQPEPQVLKFKPLKPVISAVHMPASTDMAQSFEEISKNQNTTEEDVENQPKTEDSTEENSTSDSAKEQKSSEEKSEE